MTKPNDIYFYHNVMLNDTVRQIPCAKRYGKDVFCSCCEQGYPINKATVLNNTIPDYHTGQHISNNLRALRKRVNLTQLEVSKLLGIAQQQYSKYEKNTSKLPAFLLEPLSNIFYCDYGAFFDKDELYTNKKKINDLSQKEKIDLLLKCGIGSVIKDIRTGFEFSLYSIKNKGVVLQNEENNSLCHETKANIRKYFTIIDFEYDCDYVIGHVEPQLKLNMENK